MYTVMVLIEWQQLSFVYVYQTPADSVNMEPNTQDKPWLLRRNKISMKKSKIMSSLFTNAKCDVFTGWVFKSSDPRSRLGFLNLVYLSHFEFSFRVSRCSCHKYLICVKKVHLYVSTLCFHGLY